jgi:hypothetical protein
MATSSRAIGVTMAATYPTATAARVHARGQPTGWEREHVGSVANGNAGLSRHIARSSGNA